MTEASEDRRVELGEPEDWAARSGYLTRQSLYWADSNRSSTYLTRAELQEVVDQAANRYGIRPDTSQPVRAVLAELIRHLDDGSPFANPSIAVQKWIDENYPTTAEG